MNKTLASAVLLGLVGLAGCPDIATDPDETGPGVSQAGPTVEFDPAASVVPFPNNLLLNPLTGRVNLPATCNEATAARLIRVTLLNTLDGFGTFESALTVQLSEPVDMASLDGRVRLYQRARGATATDPSAAVAIPVLTRVGVAVRYSANCSSMRIVPSLVIIARGVLDPQATYTVALTKGIETPDGTEFRPSFTWALIGQAESPVAFDAQGVVSRNETPLDPRDEAQLAQLRGLDLLHNVHKPAVDFIAGTGVARSDILIAWDFTTQSLDALDPALAGTPAAAALASTVPLQGTASVLPTGVTPTAFLTANNIPCGPPPGLPCDSIGDILSAGLIAPDYQTKVPNPIGGAPVPSAWTNPTRPMVVNANNVLAAVAVVPTGTAPAGGWPVVIFGHGLTGSKENLFAIAAQLADARVASVAIDFVAHGSRAIRVSNADGCTDNPSQTPQCFAPILSNDLAQTRDNLRQTVLDLMRLVASLKACGTAGCGALAVNSAHLTYIGMSLGGIIGSTLVAQVPDFERAVLNVPAVGLLDIVENTQSLGIRCNLVDGLIAAGIVVGRPSSMADPLCAEPAQTWKTQAGYQQFSAIARWALDPADGANYTAKLAARRILIQEVVGDETIPNVATETEAALVGLAGAAAAADPFVPGEPPSAALTDAPTTNKFVRYMNLPASGAFPGNDFQHASLLAPVGGTLAGQLGTARMQTDAIFFLTVD